MAKLTARALVMVTLLLAPCASARASSPWGWLDKLSGPGPFTCEGRIFLPVPGLTLAKDENKLVPFGESLNDRRFYVVFESASYKGETNPQFDGSVNITNVQVVFYLKLATFAGNDRNTPTPLNAVDVGLGLGGYRFDGTGVKANGLADQTFWRTVVPVRIRFTPSELLAGTWRNQGTSKWRKGLAVFSYFIGTDFLSGTFDDSNFVTSSAYRTSGNKLFTHGLIIDITPVLFSK